MQYQLFLYCRFEFKLEAFITAVFLTASSCESNIVIISVIVIGRHVTVTTVIYGTGPGDRLLKQFESVSSESVSLLGSE